MHWPDVLGSRLSNPSPQGDADLKVSTDVRSRSGGWISRYSRRYKENDSRISHCGEIWNVSGRNRRTPV